MTLRLERLANLEIKSYRSTIKHEYLAGIKILRTRRNHLWQLQTLATALGRQTDSFLENNCHNVVMAIVKVL